MTVLDHFPRRTDWQPRLHRRHEIVTTGGMAGVLSVGMALTTCGYQVHEFVADVQDGVPYGSVTCTVALRADGWNTSGSLQEVEGRLAILGEHCSDVGRDLATIEKTISFPILIRDDRAEAERVFADHLAINGAESMGNGPVLCAAPAEVADAIRPYGALGFETVICRMSAPYDEETIDRMAEVRELLDA